VAGISFDTGGLRSLAADLGAVDDRVRQLASVAVRKTAMDIERDGKAGVPPRVDTGFMRDSITTDIQPGDLEAEVGPTAEYAKYQHDGTSTIAPHPFMDRAADRNEPGFYAAMEQLAGGIL
jgi:HK97 gp10 family phage protein